MKVNTNTIIVIGRAEGIGGHDILKRVYDAKGISPTLNTCGGGNTQPKVAIPVLTPDRLEKRQNGRRFKEDGEPSFTVNTQDRHGVMVVEENLTKGCFNEETKADTREILSGVWKENGTQEIQQETRGFECIQQKMFLQSGVYGEEFHRSDNRVNGEYPHIEEVGEQRLPERPLRIMPCEQHETRRTPQRRESSQQQLGEYNNFMQELPHKDTQREKDMHNMRTESEGAWIMREASNKNEEVWQSTNGSWLYRIRKLTPKETLRLMGFSDSDYDKLKEAKMSDSQIYKVCGNSIVTNVPKSIFSSLLSTKEENYK